MGTGQVPFFCRLILSDKLDDLLQPNPVFLVESGEAVAVDVEDSGDGSVGSMDGDNDLAAGGAAAGDVPGELLDVRDDDGLIPLPGGAADALPEGDVHAGDGALERAENELVPRHAVEAGPPESEGFVQDGGDVRHLRDDVRLPLQQGGHLPFQQAVFFGLFHCNFFVNYINKNVLFFEKETNKKIPGQARNAQ